MGTAMIERIRQKRTVDCTVRGSRSAFSTIAGRCVRSSSRVTPSAGHPARERLMSAAFAAPTQTQPT